MKLIIIDNRINNISDWINTFQSDVTYVLLDFNNDTFGMLYSKIDMRVKQYGFITDILLLQDSWDKESIHILKKTNEVEICSCTCLDESWTDVITFLKALKQLGILRFDFFEYMLYLNNDMRLIMNMLQNESGLQLLNSYTFTGQLSNNQWIEKTYNAYIRYIYLSLNITIDTYKNLVNNIRNNVIRFDINGLEDGELYEFSLVAINEADQNEIICKEFAVTVPDKPNIFVSLINKQYYMITCRDISFTEQYILYVSLDGENYNIYQYSLKPYFEYSDIQINQSYYFKLIAVNFSGESEPSNIIEKILTGDPVISYTNKIKLELLINDISTVNKEQLKEELQPFLQIILENDSYTSLFLDNSTTTAVIRTDFINNIENQNIPLIEDTQRQFSINEIKYSENVSISGIFINLEQKSETDLQLTVKVITYDGYTPTSILNDLNSYLTVYFKCTYQKIYIFKYINDIYTKMMEIDSSITTNIYGEYESVGSFIKQEDIDETIYYTYKFFGPFSNIIVTQSEQINFQYIFTENIPLLYKRPKQTTESYITQERQTKSIYEFRRIYDAASTTRKMKFISYEDRIKYLQGGIYSN